MLQCMLGKEWHRTTEPAIKALPVIYDALQDPNKKRVVIIAHSQGTIIAATVLRLLYAITQAEAVAVEPETMIEAPLAYAPPEFIYPEQDELKLSDSVPLKPTHLAKLEVYCFATCANTLTFFGQTRAGQPLPWIEHFGNKYDIVARLGMQAPRPAQWSIQIDGPRYVRQRAWGHLLNAHYLFGIMDYQKVGRKRGGIGSPAPFQLVNPESVHHPTGPRLFNYINGGA